MSSQVVLLTVFLFTFTSQHLVSVLIAILLSFVAIILDWGIVIKYSPSWYIIWVGLQFHWRLIVIGDSFSFSLYHKWRMNEFSCKILSLLNFFPFAACNPVWFILAVQCVHVGLLCKLWTKWDNLSRNTLLTTHSYAYSFMQCIHFVYLLLK